MTLADVLGALLGVDAPPVGDDPAAARVWLAERGLGLAEVAGAAGFAWAGPWIARVADGGHALRFGIPSGTIDGAPGEPVQGWVVAPLDVAQWSPPPAREPGDGVVEELWLAPAAEAPVRRTRRARVVAGRGIEGDRYFAGVGTFGAGTPLTLIAAEVLEELGLAEHRRNVVTRGIDLGALVGRDFELGPLRCHGLRLCEPCAHLDRLAGGGVLRPLVHRGGLRAAVLSDGVLAEGDPVRAR